MWYIQKKKHYLATKRNYWYTMKLGNIYVKWKMPVTKSHICVIPFIENVQNRWIHRNRKQISGWQGPTGGEDGEWLWRAQFLLSWWSTSRYNAHGHSNNDQHWKVFTTTASSDYSSVYNDDTEKKLISSFDTRCSPQDHPHPQV